MWELQIRGTDLYHILNWLFIYSFLGWVWESCYVSVKEKKLVNRGFVTGVYDLRLWSSERLPHFKTSFRESFAALSGRRSGSYHTGILYGSPDGKYLSHELVGLQPE